MILVEIFHYLKGSEFILDRESIVSKVREFNRFYMPTMKLLGNHYLGSEYSVTEARVFFEIYENEGCNAAHIANAMNIDKSYLSKILVTHQKNGYIQRISSPEDRRSYHLYLTESGKERAEGFIKKSNDEISSILCHLSEKEQLQLSQAFSTIIKLLKKERNPMKVVPYNPKFKNDFIEMNKVWISKMFTIEDEDIKELDNIENYIGRGGQVFFALDDHECVMACCMIGPREDGDWEIMKFAAKGMYTGTGAGSACLKACINYAKEKQVKKIIIVSNRKCVQAVHLYRKFGFNEIPVDKTKFPFERADIAFEKAI